MAHSARAGLKVLNVGGGPSRHLPAVYRDWQQELLDIDAAVKPDIVCDAREMGKLKRAQYDAVYCSHTLEHFHRHEVPAVLAGFVHVLKLSGFAHVSVPNLIALMEAVVRGNRDIEDTWYRVPVGPISFHDVLYGWNEQMSKGNLYYAHKCGFSEKSLTRALRAAGFRAIYTAADDAGNLHAYAFTGWPKAVMLKTLGI